MKTHPAYSALLDRLIASFVPQRDKPEETPESTLRALWSVAAGTPLSSRKAVHQTGVDLDADGGFWVWPVDLVNSSRTSLFGYWN